MSVQQFCLRWNNHQPNFISVCSSLLHNGTLVDVTLAAEGRQLQAHKIVLSACSSYFQTLFTSNPCQHPIVILKDVQYDDLKTMVDFMYYGEVNVSQEQLPHILKTAEMLKIKGLAEMPTDPANLTKSESKSSVEQAELVGAGVVGCIAGTGGVNTVTGGGNASGADALWGSTETQFAPQQQQQQQQSHHHHQQQQHQQQQQHSHQQQQHHHQQSQTQTQTHHQLRRTPSPLGAGASPATRRKRLRKSSNNGSGDRNNTDEHNTSVDAGTGNLNLAQMSQLSFSTGAAGSGSVVGVASHSLHTSKIIKESVSADVETHQQDSSPDSLDDGHSHAHTMQIKPEVDIGSVQQSMPLDISGATTPSEHDAPNASCSQSQSSHSGTPPPIITSSSYAGDSSSNDHPSTAVNILVSPSSVAAATVGNKRNRFLIRQPRIKRDSDSVASQVSPEIASLEFDLHPQQQQQHHYHQQQQHHLPHHHQPQHQHHMLTVPVPPRIERHASEPAPSAASGSGSSASSSHLLAVPQTTPFLVKQHSHPLLPSQQSHGSSSSGLSRQMSHPLSISVDTPTMYQHQHYQQQQQHHHSHHHAHHPQHQHQHQLQHHISISETVYPISVSPPRIDSPAAAAATNPHYPSAGGRALSISHCPSAAGDSKSHSPITQESPAHHDPSNNQLKSKLTTTATAPPSVILISETGAKLLTTTSTATQQTTPASSSSSFDHLPTLRVKTEELQRSASSPQTSREIITLENPRSSHCPVIRPGPALGCNFCWNTIDGHGRILRRKTKYHCPECQTNLCIVPCFQEYHERLANETNQSSASQSGDNNSKSYSGPSSSSAGGGGSGGSRHHSKTE